MTDGAHADEHTDAATPTSVTQQADTQHSDTASSSEPAQIAPEQQQPPTEEEQTNAGCSFFATPAPAGSALCTPARTAATVASAASPLPALTFSAAAASSTAVGGDGSSVNCSLAREEEVVSMLSTKKRTLLHEIGALLTLRERLHAEMRVDADLGVPFDYATRFAHSPSTLKALEEATTAWREEMKLMQMAQEREGRAAARADMMLSPNARASAAAAPRSAVALSQPVRSAAPTPHQSHISRSSRSTPASASVVHRPRTAPAIASSISSVSFLSPSPIQERDDEQEENDSIVGSIPYPATSTPPSECDAYNGIACASTLEEESIFVDSAFEEDEQHFYREPQQQHAQQQPQQRQQQLQPQQRSQHHSHHQHQQQHLQTQARPQTAQPSRSQQLQHDQQTQQQRPSTSGPAYHTDRRSLSATTPSPPAAVHSSSASSSPSSSLDDSSSTPQSYASRRAALKRAATEEALRSFQGATLFGVAAEGREREREKFNKAPIFVNFNPHAGAGSNGSQQLQGRGASKHHEALHAISVSSRESRTKSPSRMHHTPSMLSPPPASTRRNDPLRNITNSSGAHTARTGSASKSLHAQHTTTPRREDVIRW